MAAQVVAVSLTSLMVHDVTLVRAGSTESRYGDSVKDWASSTSTTSKGWVSQRAREEVLDGREAQTTEWVLFLPAGTDVTGLDRVEWEGLTFEVDGPANDAWSPRMNAVHHIEINLRRVTG